MPVFPFPSCYSAQQVCCHELQMHSDICLLVLVESTCLRPIAFSLTLFQRFDRPDALFPCAWRAGTSDNLIVILVLVLAK